MNVAVAWLHRKINLSNLWVANGKGSLIITLKITFMCIYMYAYNNLVNIFNIWIM